MQAGSLQHTGSPFFSSSCVLAGLLATTFGPSNSYLLLHILYGPKYSATAAPLALALYSPYILLLAVNGVLESFVHAVASGAELWQGHLALLTATVMQTAATVWLVADSGTVGMILSDGMGMLLRISYCIYFLCKYIEPKHQSSSLLIQQAGTGQEKIQPNDTYIKATFVKKAVPSAASLAALAAGGALACLSAALLLGKGPLIAIVPRMGIKFWIGASMHISVQMLVLTALCSLLYRTESCLWQTFGMPVKKQL